jgi:hypothetical protein
MASDLEKHHKQRASDIRAAIQSEQNENAENRVNRETLDKSRDEIARENEIKFLQDQVGLVREGETREMLLNRIRRMREEKPRVIEPPPLSPEMQAQLDREQAAGRAAVAKAEAEHAKYRELWHKEEEDEKRRQPELNPLQHPNPSQEEQYPATGATLGKRK